MRSARRGKRAIGAVWWGVALAMMVVIWLGSASADGANAALGSIRGIIIDRLGIAADWRRLSLLITKTGHLLEYFLLATVLLWACRATPSLNRCAPAVAFILTIAYAVSDEWHQSFVPGRGARPLLDVLVDAAGGVVAIITSRWRDGRWRTARLAIRRSCKGGKR